MRSFWCADDGFQLEPKINIWAMKSQTRITNNNGNNNKVVKKHKSQLNLKVQSKA